MRGEYSLAMKKARIALPRIAEENFLESITVAINEGSHAEYLQRVLEEYKWYCAEFAKVFSSDQPQDAVYAFHVVYKLKKGVTRDIEIQGRQTFEKFARIIVKSMNWSYDHMHGFTVEGPTRKPLDLSMAIPARLEFFASHWEDDPYPTYKSNCVRICQIDYRKFPKLEFIFDFGDGHRFEILFRSLREQSSADSKKKFPLLTDQQGVAPEQYPNYD